MTNIDDARDFMMMRGDEIEVWHTFLKTKNAEPGTDDHDMHEAAFQAVEIFDRSWAEGEATTELVSKAIELYQLKDWDVSEDSLAGIQVEAAFEELLNRYDLSDFFARYAAEHKNDDTPVAFSNKVFVTAWTDEVLRQEQSQREGLAALMNLDYVYADDFEQV